MRNIWKIALQEYKRNVFKKGFILLLISVPVFIIISISIGIFIESQTDNHLPVGYVDHAGVIESQLTENRIKLIWQNEYKDGLDFIQFSSEKKGFESLNSNDIQVLYIISADYLETRHIEEIFDEKPGENAEWQFYDFLQLNLLVNQQNEYATRVAFGNDVIKRSIDGKRSFDPNGPTFGLIMPIFLTMAILFMILLSSGYTMNSFADEKENRTIEILITSVTTSQLVAGKILGNVVVGVTLICSWMIEIFVGAIIAQMIGIEWFSDLSIDWRTILAAFSIGIPAFALVTALMTAIGAMVTKSKEGQSVSSIFVILHLIPLYISWSFINDPHSTIAIVLSLTPFTSLMTIGMRNIFIVVPAWQIIASIGIQILCVFGAVKIANKALRFGLLNYGQRLPWKKLFKRNKKGEVRS